MDDVATPFPITRETPLDPPATSSRLAAAESLPLAGLWNGQRVRLVTRHADVRRVLSAFLDALPGLALATGLAELDFEDDSFIDGVRPLPATWAA